MVTALGFADVIWFIFSYSIFYAAFSNVEGSESGYIKKNKLYRCSLDGTETKPPLVALNWKVDLENMEMTWDSNVTMTKCSVDTPPHDCIYGAKNGTMCSFESVQRHEGVTFIAKMMYLNKTFSDTIYFPPQEDGTAAENFSCELYNVSSVNCTWNAGRNAPEDVQYFLYLKYSKNHKGEKRECPHYINNTFGRPIACHIPEMPLKYYDDIWYFYVNGSSKKSQIQYYDALLNICCSEKLGPPQSITTNCSKQPSMCRIEWSPDHKCCCPRYEIKDETKNTTECITENYKNIDVAERHIVRIRIVNNPCDSFIYGEWSEPIIIDHPSHPIPLSLILVTVGTILIILILVFFCKRYHIWHKLTTPGPQPKNLFQQYGRNAEKEPVDPIPTVHEPEEKITFIEEVTTSFKK
ncbi:granulocyte-macrophage colony-stimulating factor receptor subunit alpha-like [Sphaerodactylus townsendi]|uniref:Uncharacterized protein n=1 Tax=Sphaerodactylus townsendi TaxID=933632 RepID=A0ACB8FI83_9SAUR|nr:granulocyte-macrophage colony-stimulating factor receptor subunit alpha-like [Sphaerodactylus townsendi]